MIYNNVSEKFSPELLETLSDNDAVYSFEYLCSAFNISKTTGNINKTKVFAINVMWLTRFVELLNPKQFLRVDVIRRINSGKAVLVINHCHERSHKYSNAFYHPLWDMLLTKIKQSGVNLEQLVFLSGDRYISKSFSKENIPYRVVGLDTMEFVYNEWSKHHKVYSSPFSLDKETEFLFLNAVPREHRCVIRYLLKERGLLERSVNSWVIGNSLPILDNIKRFIRTIKLDIDPYEVYDFSSIEKKLDSDSSSLRGMGMQNFMQKDWLQNTMYSFVLETGYQENIMLVSEKTFKPMLFKHPFMVYSHPCHLSYLKECGYVTYDEIFDESYDTQTDLEKIETMISNIEQFKDRAAGKEKIINDKLEHNKQQFLSQPCLENTKKSLISIFE